MGAGGGAIMISTSPGGERTRRTPVEQPPLSTRGQQPPVSTCACANEGTLASSDASRSTFTSPAGLVSAAHTPVSHRLDSPAPSTGAKSAPQPAYDEPYMAAAAAAVAPMMAIEQSHRRRVQRLFASLSRQAKPPPPSRGRGLYLLQGS